MRTAESSDVRAMSTFDYTASATSWTTPGQQNRVVQLLIVLVSGIRRHVDWLGLKLRFALMPLGMRQYFTQMSLQRPNVPGG